MAEVKSSLVQSIKADTRKIATNTKHFGPKLPSKDESSERDEHVSESLDDMNQMIVGSFAQLIFGQSGKRKASELFGLIGKSPDNTLFGNIADIARAFGAERGRPDKRVEFAKQFAAGFSDSKRYWTSFENSIKSGITNSLTDLKIIELLQLIARKIDNKLNEKKLANEIAIKFQETKTLNELIEAIDALGKLSINKNTFKNLEKIDALTKPNGQLAQILRNMENLNADAKKINSATAGLGAIKNLITALKDSTKIGPKDVIRFRMNMFWIKHFIIKSLIETIEELSTINAKTVEEQKAIGEAIKNFNAIFDSIMKVTSMGLIKSLRIHFGLRNIQFLIETSLKETLESLSEVLKNAPILDPKAIEEISKKANSKKGIEKSTNILSQFIDIMNILQNIGEKYDIDKMRSKLDEMNGLVTNELATLMKSISKDLKVIKETQKFESLQFNIESLVHLGDFLPTWLSLFSMIAKMNFMVMYADELGDLSTHINKIPKITITKTQWTDMSEKHVSGLVQIGSLLSNADFETYSEEIKKSAKPYVNDIIKLFNDIEKFKGLDIDINRLKEISKYLTEFNKLPFDKLPKQAQLVKILDIEKVINEFVKNFKGDAFASKEDVDAMLTNIRALTMEFSPKGEIGKYLPEMIEITKNDINKLIRMGEYFDTLAKTAKKLAVIDKLMKGVDKPAESGIVKLANALKTAIDTFQDIDADEKKLELLEKSLQVFTKLVVMSAAVLLFGGLMMMIIPVTHVMLFAITLGAFVWATLKVFKSMDKEIKLSIENAKAFTILLVASAATLLFAGFIMKYLNPVAVITFAILEFAFIWALTLPYKKFAKDSQLTFDAAVGFATLVVASGLLMVLGSLLFTQIQWENVFGFAGATALFVVAMSLAFIIPKKRELFDVAGQALFDFVVLMTASAITTVIGSLLFKQIKWNDAMAFAGSTALFIAMMILAVSWPKLLGGAIGLIPNPIFQKIGAGLKGIDPMKAAMTGAKDFAILILACGLTMSIGALIAKNIPFGALFGFASNLALFMGMVMLPLILAKNGIRVAEHTGKEFAKIILISAATMIIGGLLFTWFPGIKQGVLEFAIVHGLYMMAIGVTLKGFDQMKPKELLKNAGILMLITVITAGTLLYGAKVMADNPSMTYNLPIFTVCLLGYIIGLGFAAKVLNKLDKDLMKSVLVIGLLTVVTIAAAYALSLAADMVHKYTWAEIGGGILALIGGIGLIGLAYWAMGYAAFIDGGIGLGLAAVALTAISGLTFLTVKAITYIADNQSKLSVNTIKKFEPVIKQFASLGKTIASEFFGWWTLKIPFVSATVLSLSIALSSIARAVEEYANLKVAVYEGTKVVGYRQLKESDFKSAAKNVRLVITTLGGAVIDTYDKNPEIFETNFFGQSKFSKVTKSLGTLGPMLASIAKAVQTYANLQVGEDYQKNGAGILVPTKYRQLKEQDFKDAAKNVKEIIVTLGGAVIDAYDKKPEIFETNLFGTSKFAKVTKSLKTLSPLISSIAKSVKNYADLKIADYGDQVKYVDGKPQIQRYIPLGDQHFENAAANVTTIISTLGGAIIDAYEAHPDYYESSLFGSSKFAKTVNANITLAKLISRIGKAVADMSNLKVATDWYTDGENIGKPSKYEQLKNSHFELAAKNIMTIITTLGKPIEEIAGDQTRFAIYESASGVLGIGGSKSKFMQVIEGNIKLADLISKIGRAVKDMANLKMAEEYNEKGEGTKWRQLDASDFKAAARNILAVITTLGKPIEEIASGPNFKLYEDCAGFLGIGAKKSKFVTVIEGNLKLAELISKIGSAVKDMANLRIPTGYDKEGKATGYEVMTTKHFTAAADSINAIITTLGKSIMDSYDKHKEWFEDGEDSIFAQACTAIGSMGNMISQIAGGISAYAQLKIPNWAAGVNEDGTPKQYMEMNEKTFQNAASAINSIVTHIGQTVIDTYKAHEQWFDDGEDSDFVIACTAIGHMGEMIGSIAEGIKSYAELKIPTEYDKDGKAIKFRELNNTDFENAANNIAKVISVIGSTVIQQFDTHKDWFQVKSEGDTTPFQKVMEGCTAMGEMIGSIAEGVQRYGEGKMPTEWDKNGVPTKFVKLDGKLYEEAATNIGQVVSVIGGAIDRVFYEHRGWFELPPLKKSAGFLGLGTEEAPNPSDPPFIKAIKGLCLMGEMIGSITQGVEAYASGKMPTEWDANGKPIAYTKLDQKLYTEAAKNIGDVVISLGKAVNSAYANNYLLFNNPNLSKIMSACVSMGIMLSTISFGIQSYANLSIPDEIDTATGKGKNYRKIKESDFKEAGDNIAKVILCIGTAIEDVATGELFTRWNSTNVISNVITMYHGILPVIGKLSTIIKNYASLKMPVAFDAKGTPTKYEQMKPSDISAAGKSIGDVLEAIGSAIVKTVENHSEIFGDKTLFFGINPNPQASPAYRAALAISEITKPLATMSQILAYYSMGRFPYVEGVDDKGKPILKLMTGKFDYNTVKTNIENVLLAIVTPLHDILNNNDVKDVFTKDGDKTLGSLRAEQITEMANQITALTEEIAKLGEVAIKDSTEKLNSIKNTIGTMLLEVAGIAKIFGTPIETLPQELVFTNGFNESGMFFSAEMRNQTLGQYLKKITDDKTIENTSAGITAITSAIENIFLDTKSLVEFYNKNKTIIDSFVSQSMYATIKNGMEAMVNTMASVATVLAKFNTEYNKIQDKDKIRDFAYIVFPTFSNSSIKIMNVVLHLAKNWDKFNKQLPTRTMTEKFTAMKEFVKAATHSYDFLKEMEVIIFIDQSSTNIKRINLLQDELELLSTGLRTIFTTVSRLNKNYELNEKSINWLINPYITNSNNGDKKLDETITNIINAMASTVKAFDTISIDITEFDAKYFKLMNAIKKTSEVFIAIDNMHKTYDQTIAKYLNGNEEFKGLQIVVEACRSAISTLYDYAGTETPTAQFGTPFAKWVSEVDSKVNINDLTRQLNNFNSTVRQLVEIIDYSDETGMSGYNIIVTGLDGLITKIATIPKEDNFKTHVELLERYVKAINKIDLSKIISLNNLGVTLNTLATKMGNLDKLTEALATQISTVLDRLVKELKHAEETIKKADELQKKRHDLIKKATDEVKSIMNQKMLVEIKQVQDETSASEEGGGGGSSESGDSGSQQGGSTGGSDNTGGTTTDTTESPTNDKPSKPAVTLKTDSKSAPQGNRGGGGGGNSGSSLTTGTIEQAILNALRSAKNQNILK